MCDEIISVGIVSSNDMLCILGHTLLEMYLVYQIYTVSHVFRVVGFDRDKSISGLMWSKQIYDDQK